MAKTKDVAKNITDRWASDPNPITIIKQAPKKETLEKDLCPVCEQSKVSYWEHCRICGWSNDPTQFADPDEDLCDNKMSLNQARQAYKEGREII